MTISPRRRQEIIDALRRGTVPHSSLDVLAVGLERFGPALEQEMLAVKGGGAVFKAVRGEYGCGKTFFARWLADRARKLGFATSEVQVSETETPLHRLETVYRRLCERLATADASQGALRNLIDGWFYALEQDALAEGGDRGDVRDKSLNALRQLIDEVDGGRFPGLYLLITGTPAFFDGPQGVQRLEPLAQRLHVDFRTDARFDNPRAVQVRLAAFDLDRLAEVGRRVRGIYQEHCQSAERIARVCDDAYVRDLASAVAGKLGGRVGIAPRVFLKKLVGDVLDRIDQFPDFDPRRHYALTVSEGELTAVERNAAAAVDVDDIELEP